MDDEIKEFLDYLEFEKKFSLYTVDNYDKDITEFKEYLVMNNINSFKKVDSILVYFFIAFMKERIFRDSAPFFDLPLSVFVQNTAMLIHLHIVRVFFTLQWQS